MTAGHAIGFICLGNLRETLVIFLGYNPSGALGRADSVLFALGFINRQKCHNCLHLQMFSFYDSGSRPVFILFVELNIVLNILNYDEIQQVKYEYRLL